MLRDFYTDCHAIKFLTSLVTIPRLPNSAPNVKITDDGQEISRPVSVNQSDRSVTPQQISSEPTQDFAPPPNPPPVEQLITQQTGYLYQQQQEQERIQQQLELQRQQQLQQQQEQQRLFEQQQQEQEARFLQEQQALQMQQTQQQQGRVSELEHDLLMFKNQYDNDQQLLQQYDSRVRSLENEMTAINSTATQQIASKDEQIKNLDDQISNWTKKYESLAKLYSQLRQEHLNLLAKFKKIQQKISSAQESILKKEKLEKDLKAKNVELADLIRERDRARLDLDRLRASKDQDIEKLEAEVRELNMSAQESGKLQNLNLSSIMAKHEAELDKLKNQLADRELKLGSLGGSEELQNKLKETEIELQITNESLDNALAELHRTKEDQDDIINAQIDHILLSNVEKFKNLIDIFLENNIKSVLDTKHELTTTIQAGNLNSTPEYLLSILEMCSDTATDFATTFNGYIAEDRNEDESNFSDIILSSSRLTASINDVMLNAKGLSSSIPATQEVKILELTNDVLDETVIYFQSLKSESLNKYKDVEDKIDAVIDGNFELQTILKNLIQFVETLRSDTGIMKFKGNLEDLVNDEMAQTAQTISLASQFLNDLMSNANIYGGNLEVHEMLLASAKLVTEAVEGLIKASVESQKEIVAKGKGTQSVTDFYKKNSRWTEGLISASKAVAGATNVLIHTADGVLKQSNSHEELIVASKEVAASTAQLVAASRVKANFVSKAQDNLEDSSGNVTRACKSLVDKVQSLLTKENERVNDVDLSKLTPYEGKTLEMEQQVEILKLENSLIAARKRLGEIRKHGYKDDGSDDEE
ncbi:Endocytosis protein end4 [Candida tropicalis]